MPLAPELTMPELDAPTEGTYQELLEGHDWETHLPPSPEGRLTRTADYCPGCGVSVHFLLRQDRETILAARFREPSRGLFRTFLLERGRMEAASAETMRKALRRINKAPGPTWHVPTDQDGRPRLDAKYLPLGPGHEPTFQEMMHQHRWRHPRDDFQDTYRDDGEILHACTVCPARMSVHLDRRGRVGRARVRLPAGRECHYLGDENGVRPVTGAEFHGREPLRVTRDELEAARREEPARP